MKVYILVIIILVVCALSVYGAGKKEIVFRPVTLTVLDAETKEPLEGISVKVINVTFYPKRMMFLGLVIEQTDIKTHHLYSYETDANGMVEIPQFAHKVGYRNYLSSQKIVFNIDTINPSMSNIGDAFDWIMLYDEEGDVYKRINPAYKGGYIYSTPYPLTPDQSYQSDRTKPYYTKIVNDHEIPVSEFTKKELRREPTSFWVDHEEFVVYLERFIEPEVSTK